MLIVCVSLLEPWKTNCWELTVLDSSVSRAAGTDCCYFKDKKNDRRKQIRPIFVANSGNMQAGNREADFIKCTIMY